VANKLAELAGRLPRACLEDAAHVALVRKTSVGCQAGKVSPTCLQSATHELNAQVILVFSHRAAIPFAKDARQMDGMNLHLLCNFLECERLAISAVKQFQRPVQPNGTA